MNNAQSLAQYLSTSKTSLYLTHNSGKVFLKNDTKLCIQDENALINLIDIDRIRRVVIIGRPCDLSCDVLYRMMIKKIPVDFLDVRGRPQGQLEADSTDSEYFIQAQGLFPIESALECAKAVILSKICNCKEVIRRRTDCASYFNITSIKRRISNTNNIEDLLGEEGYAARNYFYMWRKILKDSGFEGRILHPSTDYINSLLSLGYTMLRNRLTSSLKAAGLNPRMGFFHVQRGKHCALSSDLMEQFRPYVDTTVLSLINRKQIRKEWFCIDDKSGMCKLKDSDGFRTVFHAFEEMFTKIYTAYFGYEGNFKECHRSLNDMLDDTSENFASMLQRKAHFSTWRISQ